MDDKNLGSLIVVFSLLFMAGYLAWAFGPLLPFFKLWITPELSEWAYRLPVFMAVNAMLLLVLWIGYTMATTPPPIPLEKPLEIVREEYDSVSRDGGEEEN
jgi:hypothetical protein